MKKRYSIDIGKPIRHFAKGERIEVHSALHGWQPATVVGYSKPNGPKTFADFPFPDCLLYVKVDGDRHAWTCGHEPTTSQFRELLQETLL